MKAFKNYHPITNIVYFIFTIIFTVIYMHPVCLCISLFSSVCLSVLMAGKRAVTFNIRFVLPLLAAAALINPLFNHEGMTVLTYFKNGNPLTLESIYYGIAAGVMTASVINLFISFNEIITSDKIVYLFSRLLPSLSLVFSMTLRFVPKFKEQLTAISAAQKGIGRENTKKGIIPKIKNGLINLSASVTGAMENSVETADSMKSRGFGTGRRTSFSIFSFTSRDIRALIIMSGCILCIITMSFFGAVYFRYFPNIKGAALTLRSLSVFAAYFILSIYPAAIEVKEELKWKYIQSKI